jgi:hypothetical protein
MALDGRHSPSIQRLLQRVPKFRPTFEIRVGDEEGELGSYQAMSELQSWACQQSDPELLHRLFAAVDDLYADRCLPDGSELAIEFFEALRQAGSKPFEVYLGPASRGWFSHVGR